MGYSQQRIEKTNTQIADSLDISGEYRLSLKYREMALNEEEHKGAYKNFLKAKKNYTLSCIYENKGGQDNHRKALNLSQLAERLYSEQNIHKSIFFQHLIKNRIYHQYGYLGQWNNALKVAQEDLQIILDTFPKHHQKVLFIMDDLGYINSLIGDPEKANTYYSESRELYKKHHPKNQMDVYINYGKMADNYKALGLRREEFNILSDSENYWLHRSNDEDKFYLKFVTYRKLADWHNFYGNYTLSENYLQKQEKLFDSVSKSHKLTEQKALDRRDLWELYTNYIQLYYNTNEIAKVRQYIDLSRVLLKESKRHYKWDVEGEINLLFLESQLPEQTTQEAEKLLKKAIELALKHSVSHFTNPVEYQVQLLNLYIQEKQYDKALDLLNIILTNKKLEDNLKFKLFCQKGLVLSKRVSVEKHLKEFENAIQLVLKTPENIINIETLDSHLLKEFYNYDSLDGFLIIGDYFFKEYKKNRSDSDFEKAFNCYMIASDILSKIYIGDRYNEKLFSSYKSIEARFIFCLTLKNSTELTDKVLEAMENNASKLAWTKFLYNKNIKNINVPDSLLNRENQLKSLVNYYQERLNSVKKSDLIPADTLRFRLVDLKNDLRKTQDYIQQNYLNYYTRSEVKFDIKKFKQRLNNNQVVFKLSIVDSSVVAFTITKNKSSICSFKNNTDLKSTLAKDFSALSTFNSKVRLSSLLTNIGKEISILEKERITIIPEGGFNFIPFEVLLDDYLNSNKVIGYSTSLSLLDEQQKHQKNQKDFIVGLFTGQKVASETEKYLPSVVKEVEAIARICNAKVLLGATKGKFLENASNFSVLHLAMHSSIDNENPELSSLNFYDQDFLVGEIYNESLGAELAVLSACGTGFGVLQNGEGIQSISKAFTYAGVPSTVMSLWKVDDKATATLMTSFYKYLEQGKQKDVALKLAKKEYFNSDIDPELKHPYYWSAFVISGNVEPFDVNTNNHYWFLTLLFLPLGGFYFYKKSKLRK